MNDQQLKIVLGALLHDIGKVLYRASDPGDHSRSGHVFLKDEIGISDPEILDQVLYHHASRLKSAEIPDSSPAYITYIADNIASASDRRKSGEEKGFDKDLPLASIFNILNGNEQNYAYKARTLNPEEGINYPVSRTQYDVSFYKKIRQELKEILMNLNYSKDYLNSLLEVLEADLSFIPSSTSKEELADISLFDHVKLTAAIGSCIYAYTESRGITDLKTALFKESQQFYQEKAFLLFSMDVSGIQAFIYDQYGNKNVLKNLRSRSFYLEILLENIIDELLEGQSLSRANLIYSGGGHAYLLFPNTEENKAYLDQYEKEVNRWLRSYYQSDLYIAFGSQECSADELANKEEGSYRQVFRSVSEIITQKKLQRYSAEEILALNHSEQSDHERECRICHRSDHLTKEDLCQTCSGLIQLSNQILENRFFSVVDAEKGMPLGISGSLIADTEESLKERIQKDGSYVRSYVKNGMYTGQSLSTKLWVGDYCYAPTLEELVREGTGIRRLGVLRADIDNLGQAFVAGFPQEYQTLSRSATFSRKLSMFFKLYINDILKNGTFSLTGEEASERKAAVIYSGGDDVFVVGAWKDVLEFAVDLRNCLKEFTQDTLTISAGLGMFQSKYPISYIASQTGDLEDCSKNLEGKNAVTLFDESGRYHWDTLIEKVIGEKFQIIYQYFDLYAKRQKDSGGEVRGKAFLYRMLDLFRLHSQDAKDGIDGGKINLARMAYVLARTEPAKDADEQEKQMYQTFSRSMYQWMQDQEESRQAVTAIYLYAYLVRSSEE